MSESVTIDQAIVMAKREYVEELRQARRRLRGRIGAIQSNGLACRLLAPEGFDLSLSRWCPHVLQLDLENRQALARVRKALGCSVKSTGQKEPVAGSRSFVWVHVEAAGFPGLTIRYKQKLPKGAKCKVVNQRRTFHYRAVVCDR